MIIYSGAPKEAWLYALKYVATIHNWTSNESLNWKTPYEKRHGVMPDISSLLAYRFYQPVYYYVDEGFPDSGERLGYVLGLNENVGSHMTFDILTDETQEVIPRSVLRPVNVPVRNARLQPSSELDPTVRVRDRVNLLRRNPVEGDIRQREEPADFGPRSGRTHQDALDMAGRLRSRMETPEVDLEIDPDYADLPELIARTDYDSADEDGDEFGDDADIRGLFRQEELPMHRRRPWARKQPVPPPTVHVEKKRKRRNVSTDKKEAPSNKKKKKPRKKKVTRLYQPPTAPTMDEKEYTIDKVLDHRRSRSGEFDVLIAWEGFDSTHNSWEPMSVIRETAPEELARYGIHKKLDRKRGWTWIRRYRTKQLLDEVRDEYTTDPRMHHSSTHASVEGRQIHTMSKRSKNMSKRTKNNKSNTNHTSKRFESPHDKREPNTRVINSSASTKKSLSANAKAIINNVLATFGIAKNNDS